jgi:hypothetical protein
MTLINQVLAEDVSISTLPNPAPKLAGIKNIGGLLTDGGFDLLNFVFVIIGIILFANLIMTGWDFMMSSGDAKKVSAASTRLVNGFIGVVMAAVAFVIVRLITNMLGLGNLI